MDPVTTETIYDGSKECPKCGIFMTPLEVLYAGGKICPDCRNKKYEYHTKNRMAG